MSSGIVSQILERYSTDKEYELQKSHDKQSQFHTLRYDFKPASVNSDEPASLELTSKGEVTIKAPNISGSSSSHTVFRGQRRPHVKECLLVIDNRTGEMVLQKLTDNITVKATRTLGPTSSNAPHSAGSNISSKANNNSVNNNSNNSCNNNGILNSNNHTDGPQLSEESSSSSDDDSSDSGSSSSSSSSGSESSSPSNDEGFTF